MVGTTMNRTGTITFGRLSRPMPPGLRSAIQGMPVAVAIDCMSGLTPM